MEFENITTEQLVNALDCWLNHDSDVACDDCPFHLSGHCKDDTLQAVTERLRNSAPKLIITKKK